MTTLNTTTAVSVSLDADPRNVGEARQMLRQALLRSGAEHLVDSATLVLSEVVTNAFVHAGTAVRIGVWSTQMGVRVEVEDGVLRKPARRRYADTAGTGRGLQLLDGFADRWGTLQRPPGKTVWFEIGAVVLSRDEPPSELGVPTVSPKGMRLITLRHVPLLMHTAWQEHAASLLREYLLQLLDQDPGVLDRHAQASEAMNLLDEQLPVPQLGDDPEAIMADAVGPAVTADEVTVQIPVDIVPFFVTLNEMLHRASAAARAGQFLSPPTQPEIEEMRQWICSETARQAAGESTATPWLARSDVRATLADQAALTETYATLAAVDEPLLATDEASIIVAASRQALDLLGYERAEDLLGRRVIVVVPERFHQAHIAGTTLNATNGRDALLGVPLTVPMVRRDRREVSVNIEVCPERLADDQRVFVARFTAA